MPDQLNLFSAAIDHKIQAIAYLKELDFRAAQEEIGLSQKIDPYLADLNIIANAIAFLNEQVNSFPDSSTADRLAHIWQTMPKAVEREEISLAGLKFLDSIVAPIALKEANTEKDFVDSECLLHKGVCFLALREINHAHKLLLDAVTSGNFERADLWGYLGDTLYLQHNVGKARAAYLHALVIDPQELDLLRLAYQPIFYLYNQLRHTYSEIEAKDLLLTYGWFDGIFEIPKKDDRLTRLAMNLWNQINQGRVNSDRHYYHFSISLYLDQSQPPGQIYVEARERMMDLDRQLFNRYLEKVTAQPCNR